MLGLSTYAFIWRMHPEMDEPLGLEGVMDSCMELGVGLVQLCDTPQVEAGLPEDLAAIRAYADRLGLEIETGTRGVEVAHLRKHLATAVALRVGLVRSMLSSVRGVPSVADAVAQLSEVMPEFEAAGVTLALETYEQFSSAELVSVVEQVGSERLGICLDPGNSVGRLEHPMEVARTCAPYVVNHHVKDFCFTRLESGVGFRFAGARLGEGLLDHAGVCAVLEEAGRGDVNRIVEHWLPRLGTLEEAAAEEAEWVAGAVEYLDPAAGGRVRAALPG